MERPEKDYGLVAVDLAGIAPGLARQILPAVKIDVGFKVGLPSVLDGGLEGQDQHPLGVQFLGKLIAGEGLAEAHFRVPKETRNGGGILPPAGLVVGIGLFDRSRLLVARREILVMGAGELLARAQFGQHGFYIGDGALHPFEPRVGKSLAPQRFAHGMIGDDATVISFGPLIQLDGVVRDRCGLELLRNALFHVACRLPNLEQPSVAVCRNRVDVNTRASFWLWGEDFLDCRPIHPQPPWGGS